jgi:hypothetical protein
MKLDRHEQYACDTRTQHLPFVSASIGFNRKSAEAEGLIKIMIKNVNDQR